jgi:hypothetical protein
MVDRAAAFVVVVLCLLALGLTASTLSATDAAERGAGEGPGTGVGDDPLGQQPPTNETSDPEPPGIPTGWLAAAIAAAFALAVPSLLFLGRYRLLGVVLGMGFIALVVAVLWLVTGDGTQGLELPAPNGSGSGEGGGDLGAADESSDRNRPGPSPLALGVVGLALVTAVGLVVYASSSVDASVDPEPAPEPTPSDPTAVAEAASRAAGRIADSGADTENAVYEAWSEMTDALDVADPATSTPREFERAAVDAGMDPDRVADLTDLFEAVRYGDEPPSDDHERRAVEALRAIEAAHDAVAADVDGATEAAERGSGDDPGDVGDAGDAQNAGDWEGDR